MGGDPKEKNKKKKDGHGVQGEKRGGEGGRIKKIDRSWRRYLMMIMMMILKRIKKAIDFPESSG